MKGALGGAAHRAGVAALEAVGLQTRGFWRELRALDEFGACTLRSGVPRSAPRPDAFLVRSTAREVFVFEVECFNPVSYARLLDYADVWFMLDSEEETTMRLFVVDRLGGVTELDLARAWYALAQADPTWSLPFGEAEKRLPPLASMVTKRFACAAEVLA